MIDLPLFPLNTVLFPGIPLHLHIFEPRYLFMVRTCLETDSPFGVVLIRKGMEAYGPLAETHLVGTSARIIEIQPLDDGHMDLTALGDERFQIEQVDKSLPYLVGHIRSLNMPDAQTLQTNVERSELNDKFLEYLKLLARVGETDVNVDRLNLPEETLLLTYLAASMLQIPMMEKQILLEISSGKNLFDQVNRLLRRELTVLNHTMDKNNEKASRMAWLN